MRWMDVFAVDPYVEMTPQLDYFPIIEKWNGRTHDEEKSDRIC